MQSFAEASGGFRAQLRVELCAEPPYAEPSYAEPFYAELCAELRAELRAEPYTEPCAEPRVDIRRVDVHTCSRLY